MQASRSIVIILALIFILCFTLTSAQDLIISGDLSNPLYQVSNGSLIVNGASSTIQSDKNVIFAATNQIHLTGEFTARAGCEFNAIIYSRTDAPDSDSDGLPDFWEKAYNLNPSDNTDAALDSDGDGILNLAEYQNETNPRIHEPPAASIILSKTLIQKGGSTTLQWDSQFAALCTITNIPGPIDLSGSIQVNPVVDTTYTVCATGPGGTVRKSIAVQVADLLPAINLGFSQDYIFAGDSTTLSWNVTNAETVSIDQGIGDVAADNTMVITPRESMVYTISATIGPYTVKKSAVVTVEHFDPQVEFSADPATVQPGQVTTLTWNSRYGLSASIDNGIGAVPLNGSVTIVPDGTKIYTITVAGVRDNATASVIAGDFTDADSDTLPDAWEITYFKTIDRYGALDDPDGDHMNNHTEFNTGTAPNRFNTESHTLEGILANGYYGSGGLITLVCAAAHNGTNIRIRANNDVRILPETHLENGSEVIIRPGDADRLPDDWEMEHFNTLAYTDNDDPDRDGVSNYEEFILSLSPGEYRPDSDGDDLADAWELQYFGNLDQGYNGDFDHDGIKNFAEELLKTDPTDYNDHPEPGNYYEYDALGRIKKIIRVN